MQSNVIEAQFEDNFSTLIKTAKNLAESMESTGGFPLRQVKVEKGYAHFYHLLDIGEVQIEMAYAQKDTIGLWHTHTTLEIIVVFKGKVIFEEEHEAPITLTPDNPVGQFYPESKHRPYFPTDCKAVIILVPADPKLKV